MTTVKYLGPYGDHSGYGEATRNAIFALKTANVDVITEKVGFTGKKFEAGITHEVSQSLEKKSGVYKIKILHVTPDLYPNYIEKGKHNIGHLFWETDKLPASWVAPCNKMDELWTGTLYNATVIKNSGVTVPIYVFPQSCDTNINTSRPFKLPGERRLTFYSIFEWNERKNPKALLEAYWKEFKNEKDVCLLLKVHKGDYEEEGFRQIRSDIMSWRASLGFDTYPDVFLCTRLLSRDEMQRLHATGDCFISAHRGEGWGLPQVEATMANKPIISVRYGGVHEYLKSHNLFSVEYALVPVVKYFNKYYEPGMLWAEANEESLRKKMRQVHRIYTNPKTRRLLGLKSSSSKKIVKAQFSYEVVGQQMAYRLGEIDRKL